MKKISFFIIMLLCAMAMLLNAFGAVREDIEEISACLIEENPSPYSSSVGGEWLIIALAQAGYKNEAYYNEYLNNLEKALKENEGVLDSRKMSGNSRAAIALRVLGENPRSFRGYDLIKPLENLENVSRQGVTGVAYALIAIDKEALPIKGEFISYLENKQNTDGSFSLSGSGDSDVTAVALRALYSNIEIADEGVIEKAVAWLDDNGEAGVYSSFNQQNAESTAQVIATYYELEEWDRVIISGEALYAFRVEGGFSHIHNGGRNQMASEQGLLALCLYEEALLYKEIESMPLGRLFLNVMR